MENERKEINTEKYENTAEKSYLYKKMKLFFGCYNNLLEFKKNNKETLGLKSVVLYQQTISDLIICGLIQTGETELSLYKLVYDKEGNTWIPVDNPINKIKNANLNDLNETILVFNNIQVFLNSRYNHPMNNHTIVYSKQI